VAVDGDGDGDGDGDEMAAPGRNIRPTGR